MLFEKACKWDVQVSKPQAPFSAPDSAVSCTANVRMGVLGMGNG